MNFAAEKKYLDDKSFLSFDELYQDHQQAILNSEKILSPNFTFTNLNFNLKKHKFCLTNNIDFIQYNFFFNLNNKFFNLTPEQKNIIDIFYLNNFLDKYYLLQIQENESFATFFHTLLYSILNDSDIIFNNISHYFNSDFILIFF